MITLKAKDAKDLRRLVDYIESEEGDRVTLLYPDNSTAEDKLYVAMRLAYANATVATEWLEAGKTPNEDGVREIGLQFADIALAIIDALDQMTNDNSNKSNTIH